MVFNLCKYHPLNCDHTAISAHYLSFLYKDKDGGILCFLFHKDLSGTLWKRKAKHNLNYLRT